MISVSLCMIVKNEEKVLQRCLESVKDLVDEINIIDTGSSDRTKEIASRYTDRIYDFKWIDDFAAARNFSFSKATKEYTFWLDADDILLPDDQEKFLKVKETLEPIYDSVKMVYALDRSTTGEFSNSLMRNRLVKTEKGYKWIGKVHEYLEVIGTVFTSDICVTHLSIKTGKTDRNLRIYEKQKEEGVPFSPRDLYYYGNECYELGEYKKAFESYRAFLDTEKGWVEDCIGAYDKGGECLLQLGREKEAELFFYESFVHDLPRANICCKLGYLYLSQRKYYQAVHWYRTASEADYNRVKNTGAIVNAAYYTWLPHLQLCVCYDAMGKYEQAFYHNEMARLYNPMHPSVLSNKEYLEKKLSD